MAGERSYTRIPPESTGDRVLLRHTTVLPYTGKDVSADPTHNWVVGGEYEIVNAGGNITVNLFKAVARTASVGELYIRYNDLDEHTLIDADVGVDVRYNGTQVATTASGKYDLYVNQNTLVGHDNPDFGVEVDRFGALNTRFAEGSPQVTAYGQMRISEQRLLAQYDFATGPLNDEFATISLGRGHSIWDSTLGAHRLSVSGISGDKYSKTSNIWHPYVPGSSTLYLMSTRCGTRIQGVIRQWGCFDETDGFFFRQSGTQLAIGHKWILDGGGQKEHIVTQTNWNEDTLDGTGGVSNPSGMNLDITKINMYWIDYEFSGGGKTRWGVFHKGDRIVCHIMYHANGESAHLTDKEPLGNPNRPLRWSIVNGTDADAQSPEGSGNSANLYAFGGSVYIESDVNPLTEGNARRASPSVTTVIPSTYGFNDYLYAATLSPQINKPQTVLTTLAPQNANVSSAQLENHSIYSPESLEVFAYDVIDEIDPNTLGPLNIEASVYQNSVLRGLNRTAIDITTVDIDIDADYLADGYEFSRFYVRGDREYKYSDIFNTLQNGAVTNTSEQTWARTYQNLALFEEAADPENTGVNRIVVTVKDHPIFGPNKDIHYFPDKGLVNLRNPPAIVAPADPEILLGFTSQGTLKTSDNDWYNISFINSNKAWLYTSNTNLNDDRNARKLTLDANNQVISVGDKIIFDYPGNNSSNCVVLSIDNFPDILVEGRSNNDIDTTMLVTASNTFTFGATGTGSVSAVVKNGVGVYPLDYKTSLKAISNTDVGITLPGNSIADQNALYGIPPTRSNWSFKFRHLTTKTNNTNVLFSMNWKERLQ